MIRICVLARIHTHTHTHAFEPHTVRRSRSQWIKLIASYSYLLLRPLTHWIREILRGQRHSPYQDALLNCILRDIFRFRSVLRWSLWSYGVLRHICVLTEIQTQTWLKLREIWTVFPRDSSLMLIVFEIYLTKTLQASLRTDGCSRLSSTTC